MRQRLLIMLEPTLTGHQFIERFLAGVAERRVAEVVGERDRLGQLGIETGARGRGAGDLTDLQRMGESGAEVVAFMVE